MKLFFSATDRFEPACMILLSLFQEMQTDKLFQYIEIGYGYGSEFNVIMYVQVGKKIFKLEILPK